MNKPIGTMVNIFKVTISEYGSTVLHIVRGIIVAKVLGPLSYGIWSTILIFAYYLSFSHLGLFYSFSKELPYWRGKKDENKVHSICTNVFTFSVITVCLLALGVIVYLVFNHGTLSRVWVWGLLSLAIMSVLTQLYQYFYRYYQYTEDFNFFYKLNLYGPAILLVLMVVGVLVFGIYGLFAGYILGYLLIVLWAIHRSKWKIQLGISTAEFLPLLKIALPLFGYQLFFLLYYTIDRIMIIRFLGQEAMGLYSFAFRLATVTLLITSGIQIVYRPQVMRLYRSTGEEKEQFKSNLLRMTNGIIYAIPPFILVFFVGLFFFISKIFAAYKPSIFCLSFLLLSGYLFSNASLPGYILVAAEKYRDLIKTSLTTLLVAIAANSAAIYLKTGIAGIAVATALSTLVYAYIMIKKGFPLLGISTREPIRNLILNGMFICIQFTLIIYLVKIPTHTLIPNMNTLFSVLLVGLVVLALNFKNIKFIYASKIWQYLYRNLVKPEIMAGEKAGL